MFKKHQNTWLMEMGIGLRPTNWWWWGSVPLYTVLCGKHIRTSVMQEWRPIAIMK